MVRPRRLIQVLTAALAFACYDAYGWGSCDLKITLPDDPKLECSGEATADFEIEAEIISDEALSSDVNCIWTDRYEGLERLPRIGDVCRARITVDKPEAYFITVTYSDGPTTKTCTSTRKLDVKPLCCLVL